MQNCITWVFLVLVGDSLAIENTQNVTKGCSADEFMCQDFSCIPLASKCDGRKDCFLDEDEKDCACGVGLFHCDDGHCISDVWVCDGHNDCMDQSDEKNCSQMAADILNVTCPDGQFKCGGLCILSVWLCDGTPDCILGEDEAEEQCHVKPKDCGSEQF